MLTTINWARLVNSGRAKAVGVSWNEEELSALKSGISAEDVRAGILTKEKKDDSKPKLEQMKREDLIGVAKELGIVFDEKAVTRETLIMEIKNVEAKEKKEPEAPKKPEAPKEPEAPEEPEEEKSEK